MLLYAKSPDTAKFFNRFFCSAVIRKEQWLKLIQSNYLQEVTTSSTSHNALVFLLSVAQLTDCLKEGLLLLELL